MTIRNISRHTEWAADVQPLRSAQAWPGRLLAWLSLTLAAGLATAQPSADAFFGAPTMIDTQAGRLAVFEVGHGSKAVVYWSSVFADHTMYRFQASGLGPDYRQVFIDGPGHGVSGPQPLGATLETHAAAVVQVMDRLGIARATFVGTSWGGLVGALVARDHPDRLNALVALNTPFETHAGGPAFGDRMTVWAAGLFGNRGFFADGAAKAFFSKTSLDQHPEKVESFKSRFLALDRDALGQVLRTVLLDRQSQLPWLHRITVPVVVVAGAEDPVITPEQTERAAGLIPSVKFVRVGGAGHLSALEVPEAINPLIVAAAK
jgi:3-oxoadipate enol-lactonase